MSLGVSYCYGVGVLKEVLIIILCIVVVYCFFIVFGNLLIILLILLDLNKNFYCIFFIFFIFNLVIIDLIVGVMVELLFMVIYWREVYGLLVFNLWLL